MSRVKMITGNGILTPGFKGWLVTMGFVLTFGFSFSGNVHAMSSLQANYATRAAPAVLQTAGDVVKIAASALRIVNVPLGALEVGLSPLPGLTVMQGVKRIGQGLMVPVHILQSVIRLPVKAVRNITGNVLSKREEPSSTGRLVG